MGKEIIEIIQKKITTVFMLYMFIVFPWYYHNNYIDIMEAKRMVFSYGAAAYLFAMLVLAIIGRQKVKRDKWVIGLILLAIIAIIGLIASPNIEVCIWGLGGKCTGFLMYILAFGCMYFIAEYGQWSFGLTWGLLLGSTMVALLQILNRWGMDPLHMYDNLAESDIATFISTIGQVNYNASYNCIIMGILVFFYMLCKERISQMIYAICLVIIFMGAMCCCSNSVYVVLLVLLYMVMLYSMDHVEKSMRLAQLVILLEAAVGGMYFIYTRKSVYLWDTTELLMIGKMQKFIFLLVVLFVIGCLICRASRKKIWKSYLLIIMIGMPVGAIYAIYRFTNHINIQAQITWSSYRFEIWNNCKDLFIKSDLFHKLFGWGFNCVNLALQTIGKDKLAGVAITDAHSVILNTLITSGILGTAVWLWLLATMMQKAIKRCKQQPEVWIIISGIIVYMVQGCFNGPQILTTPLFLILLGIYCNMCYNFDLGL